MNKASVPIEKDVPVVLRRQRPHRLEKVALGIVALLGGRVGLWVLGQAREVAGEELRAGGHVGAILCLVVEGRKVWKQGKRKGPKKQDAKE